MTIQEVISEVERTAPLRYQESWDNCGLQIGDPAAEVTGVLCCLDITEEVIAEAESLGYNLVISHHPLFFAPIKHLTGGSVAENCAVRAVRAGIGIYSAHTSLDNSPLGVNHRFADILGLENVTFLSSDDGQSGSGAIGVLPGEVPVKEFAANLKDLFSTDCILASHGLEDDGRMVKKIALCGGSGAFLYDKARSEGADCFITGEMSYHNWFVPQGGPVIFVLGHYQSELHTCGLLFDIVSMAFPQLSVKVADSIDNPIHYFI